jgi:hypothetical protein
MRNSAEIQLIGYVYQDARRPNEQSYPNWVTFKLCVNKKYKDKNGQDQQDSSWFECKSNSENMSKILLTHVKDKMGVLVKGVPKAKAYISSNGTAESVIEVLVTNFDILTYPRLPEEVKLGDEQQSGKYKIGDENKVLPDTFLDDEIPF